MADTNFKYPVPSFNFEVYIDGNQIGFQEVSGLEQSAGLLEYRHGNSKAFITQKRVGMQKASTVTLKKGIFIDDDRLIEEYSRIEDKIAYLSTGSTQWVDIYLLDEHGIPVMYWWIDNAVPTKISGPSLKADSNELAFESIEFAHEGIHIGV